MTDAFSSYEHGLKALLERLGKDHPRYPEALTLQSRLLENIAHARLYGDNEIRRAERAQIVDGLNKLAMELGVSFVELIEDFVKGEEITIAELLENARRLATKGLFAEAFGVINSAYALAAGPGEIDRVEEVERSICHIRSLRVQSLEQELSNQLNKPIDEFTEEGVRLVDEIIHLLLKIHPDPEALESKREKWLSLRRSVEVHRAYTETKARLEKLWLSPYILLSRYDEALVLARRMVSAYPDQSCFVELLRDAEKRREEAYRRSGELTTQAATGNFQSLINELMRLYEHGDDILPWFEWSGRGLVIIGTKDASLAIQHLLGLATAYYSNKALEYRKRAEADLPHNPESAAEWIEAARRLPYLSKEDHFMLQQFFNDIVLPIMEKRKRAKELVAQALLTQDPVYYPLRFDATIASAWMLLQEAEILDPHYVEIIEARESLRPLLRLYLEKELRRAEQELVTGGAIQEVAKTATYLYHLLEGDPDLKDYRERIQLLIRRCQKQSNRDNQVH
jgi:hypothetical protein